MIYAAAFHIFHCFQVFGSICKIKFVMRPTVSLPPPASAAFATPSTPIQLLCAHNQSRRIWPIGQFPSRASISVPKFDEDFSSFRLFFFYDPRKFCFLFAPKSNGILLYCSSLFLYLFFSTLCLLDHSREGRKLVSKERKT